MSIYPSSFEQSPEFMPATSVSRRRALIIEDDPAACEVLQKALTLLGHEACCARTVHQGLREVERFKPTHVLLDLMFPDGEGDEILQYIHARRLPVRVAVMSALSPGDRVFDSAVALGARKTFHKPWNLNDITEWLRQEPSAI